MRLNPTGLLRNLGVRRFVQMIAYLPSFVKVFSRLVKDPKVTLGPKLILAVVLTYVILPIDLIPDFVLGFGQVDDLVVIFLGLKLFLKLCPKEVVQRHVRTIADGQ